jgi:hypothetical protein
MKGKKMLNILNFIKNNKDWENKISQNPYNIKVSRCNIFGRNLMMLKYNQLSSDFNDVIVRECRGLIIDEDSLQPVSVPFFKFGNYGESYCPNIDWKSAKVLEKIDGSLIKIVNLGDDLLISTNGTIDAFSAELQLQNDEIKSFGDLVMKALDPQVMSLFEVGYTYMFELTSKYNKVVIPYDGINLSLIGIRDNNSLEELDIYSHKLSNYFNKPKQYGFSSLEECINSAKELPYTEEGYVVVDKNFNRVKIKSLEYVNVHHLKGEGILTPKKALDLIRNNEVDEFLVYFDEYKVDIDDVRQKYLNLISSMEADLLKYKEIEASLESRKDKALWINANSKYKSICFDYISGKLISVKNYVESIPSNKIIDMLKRD